MSLLIFSSWSILITAAGVLSSISRRMARLCSAQWRPLVYRLIQAYRCTETGLPGVQSSLELVPGLQKALLRHREARVLMIRPNVAVHSLLLYVFPQILLS